jgi:hypothetical protein
MGLAGGRLVDRLRRAFDKRPLLHHSRRVARTGELMAMDQFPFIQL